MEEKEWYIEVAAELSQYMLVGATKLCVGLNPEGIRSMWGGGVWNIKLDKGEFIIKKTFSCTVGFNSPTRTPENQDNMLLD